MRRLSIALAVSLLPCAALLAAVPDFHRAALTSGTVEVRLQPTEVITTNAPVRVTFGVPLPRGSLPVGQLATVKVLRNGDEIPANVAMLTPWRHTSNAAQDASSVRVLRIQVEYTFSAPFPASESVSVQWGGSARTVSLDFRDPRTAWHQVTDTTTSTGGATFGPEHNVFEPDVYALLPAEWLATSGLKSPTAAMDSSISLARIPAAQVPAAFTGYREADQAQVNFFYSVINDDEPNTEQSANNTNYFSQVPPPPHELGEPWLYDRATTLYVGYLRSGGFRFLREAVRNADYYRQLLYTAADCNDGACVGSFRLKNQDPAAPWHDAKYSYNESLALTYWLTGDELALARVRDVTRVYEDVATSPNPNSFTERHSGLKWLANVVAYEVTGEAQYKTELLGILTDFRNAQTAGPSGAPDDGGIWHSIRSHEGVASDTPITSPWMSALIADAAARAYLVSEDARIAQLLRGLANHICGAGSYMTTIRNGDNGLADQSNDAPLRFPHYLATADGLGWQSTFDPFVDYEHAFDTAAIAAWGAYFAARAGAEAEKNLLLSCGNELYTTFSHVITYWTRPNSTSDDYRVNPNRKYNWWFKNASGFSWAMTAARAEGGAPPQEPPPPPPPENPPPPSPPPGSPGNPPPVIEPSNDKGGGGSIGWLMLALLTALRLKRCM